MGSNCKSILPLATPLPCKGKNGERTFYVTVKEYLGRSPRVDNPEFKSTHWDIEVHRRRHPNVAEDDRFTFDARQVEGGRIMSVNMNANADHYREWGIPAAVIQHLRTITDYEIISSSWLKETRIFETEWQSQDSFDVWKRLVEEGKAEVVPGEHRYRYLG